ncbi:hypothetical protein Droror1_Dr00017211 [Drosera rotundifolia]
MRPMSSMAMMRLIMLSMMIVQLRATSFQQCYVPCYLVCAIEPDNSLSYCAFECLKDCIFPPTSSITAENGASASAHVGSSFKFCNLGCAALHCANMSNLQNPGGKEVEGCVISCSEGCRKNYSVPYSPKH